VKYDLIIVSKSTPDLIPYTEQTINTALQDKADVNVIIIETSGKEYPYKNAKSVLYKGSFNYNRALNLGLKEANGDVHILANNDLYFHKGWSQIGDLMALNGFDSASALSGDRRQFVFKQGDWIYPGYTIGAHLTGWCIFATKKCIETIQKLDESFEFWYSDNVYAEQLQKAGLRHGLFCNIRVDHVTSQTIRTISPTLQVQYTRNATRKYNKR